MSTTPRPLDGEVHLYCLALPQESSELSRLGGLLSASESDRAGLLKSDMAKNRYIAGRGVLREILSRYLEIEPADVRISTGEHGKPYLADCAKNIRFNLSHTGDVLLLAVSTSLEVGVDIETIETDKPLNDMARLALSLREQEELFSLATHLQTKTFYRFWVRKEACLKASGGGFSLLNDSFDVNCCNKETPVLTVCCNQSFWQVLDIQVPQPYCAALAVEASCSSHSPSKIVWVVPESRKGA